MIALLTLLIGNTFYARNIVASILVMVWAVRIAGDIAAPDALSWWNLTAQCRIGFLLFRVLKMGSDSRFDTIRSHFFKFMGLFLHLSVSMSSYQLFLFSILDHPDYLGANRPTLVIASFDICLIPRFGLFRCLSRS